MKLILLRFELLLETTQNNPLPRTDYIQLELINVGNEIHALKFANSFNFEKERPQYGQKSIVVVYL